MTAIIRKLADIVVYEDPQASFKELKAKLAEIKEQYNHRGQVDFKEIVLHYGDQNGDKKQIANFLNHRENPCFGIGFEISSGKIALSMWLDITQINRMENAIGKIDFAGQRQRTG